jgi:hypothetical protein
MFSRKMKLLNMGLFDFVLIFLRNFLFMLYSTLKGLVALRAPLRENPRTNKAACYFAKLQGRGKSLRSSFQ